jgi:hypothetical protein
MLLRPARPWTPPGPSSLRPRRIFRRSPRISNASSPVSPAGLRAPSLLSLLSSSPGQPDLRPQTRRLVKSPCPEFLIWVRAGVFWCTLVISAPGMGSPRRVRTTPEAPAVQRRRQKRSVALFSANVVGKRFCVAGPAFRRMPGAMC